MRPEVQNDSDSTQLRLPPGNENPQLLPSDQYARGPTTQQEEQVVNEQIAQVEALIVHNQLLDFDLETLDTHNALGAFSDGETEALYVAFQSTGRFNVLNLVAVFGAIVLIVHALLVGDLTNSFGGPLELGFAVALMIIAVLNLLICSINIFDASHMQLGRFHEILGTLLMAVLCSVGIFAEANAAQCLAANTEMVNVTDTSSPSNMTKVEIIDSEIANACAREVDALQLLAFVTVVLILRFRFSVTAAVMSLSIILRGVGRALAQPGEPEGFWISYVFVLLLSSIFVVIAKLVDKSDRRRYANFVRARALGAHTIEAKETLDATLRVLLPVEVVAAMASGDQVLDISEKATISVCDVFNFVQWSLTLVPKTTVELLNVITALFDEEVARLGLRKIKALGDRYITGTSLKGSNSTKKEGDEGASANSMSASKSFTAAIARAESQQAANIVNFALFQVQVAKLIDAYVESSLAFHIGIHTGHCFGAVVGTTSVSYEVFGEAILVAQNLVTIVPKDSVAVSENTYSDPSIVAAVDVSMTAETLHFEMNQKPFEAYVVEPHDPRRPRRDPRGGNGVQQQQFTANAPPLAPATFALHSPSESMSDPQQVRSPTSSESVSHDNTAGGKRRVTVVVEVDKLMAGGGASTNEVHSSFIQTPPDSIPTSMQNSSSALPARESMADRDETMQPLAMMPEGVGDSNTFGSRGASVNSDATGQNGANSGILSRKNSLLRSQSAAMPMLMPTASPGNSAAAPEAFTVRMPAALGGGTATSSSEPSANPSGQLSQQGSVSNQFVTSASIHPAMALSLRSQAGNSRVMMPMISSPGASASGVSPQVLALSRSVTGAKFMASAANSTTGGLNLSAIGVSFGGQSLAAALLSTGGSGAIGLSATGGMSVSGSRKPGAPSSLTEQQPSIPLDAVDVIIKDDTGEVVDARDIRRTILRKKIQTGDTETIQSGEEHLQLIYGAVTAELEKKAQEADATTALSIQSMIPDVPGRPGDRTKSTSMSQSMSQSKSKDDEGIDRGLVGRTAIQWLQQRDNGLAALFEAPAVEHAFSVWYATRHNTVSASATCVAAITAGLILLFALVELVIGETSNADSSVSDVDPIGIVLTVVATLGFAIRTLIVYRRKLPTAWTEAIPVLAVFLVLIVAVSLLGASVMSNSMAYLVVILAPTALYVDRRLHTFLLVGIPFLLILLPWVVLYTVLVRAPLPQEYPIVAGVIPICLYLWSTRESNIRTRFSDESIAEIELRAASDDHDVHRSVVEMLFPPHAVEDAIEHCTARASPGATAPVYLRAISRAVVVMIRLDNFLGTLTKLDPAAALHAIERAHHDVEKTIARCRHLHLVGGFGDTLTIVGPLSEEDIDIEKSKKPAIGRYPSRARLRRSSTTSSSSLASRSESPMRSFPGTSPQQSPMPLPLVGSQHGKLKPQEMRAAKRPAGGGLSTRSNAPSTPVRPVMNSPHSRSELPPMSSTNGRSLAWKDVDVERVLQQAVTSAMGLLFDLRRRMGSNFTAVAVVENVMCTITGHTTPAFTVAGVAIRQARALLEAASAGFVGVSDTFVRVGKEVGGKHVDTLGTSEQWAVRGVGRMRMHALPNEGPASALNSTTEFANSGSSTMEPGNSPGGNMRAAPRVQASELPGQHALVDLTLADDDDDVVPTPDVIGE